MVTAQPEALDDEIAPSLRARMRLGCMLLLLGSAIYLPVDVLMVPSPDPRIWISRSVQIVVILAALWWSRRPRPRPILITVCLCVLLTVFVTMMVGWTLRGDIEAMRLLAVATALSAAALIPWGMWSQLACSVMAAASIVAHVALIGRPIEFPSALLSISIITVLSASVLVARELEQQRRIARSRRRQRDRAVAELAESEMRFRGAFDNAPIGMALVAPDGRWLEVNRRTCEIVGYDENELLARDFQSITHPEDLDLDLTLLAETVAGKRAGYEMDKRYIHKNGHVVWVLLAVSLVRRTDGSPQYFVAQIEDVTARVEAERELEVARDQALRASKAKSEFLATMSHELRTPLGAIIGMADILRDSNPGGEQREFIETIHRSGLSLLTIINDVLDLAKVESGVIHLDMTEFDPCIVLQESCDLFAAETGRKGLALTWDAAPELPERLRGDAGRLRQVLVNLIGNAVKFTPRGAISVAAGVERCHGTVVEVRFTVRDSGIGMDESVQSRIFDAFVQANPSTSRQHGGSGLGLAICKHLVQLMGGTIGVTSRPGEGTSVSFTVALELPNEGAARPRLASAPGGGLDATESAEGAGRILAVDDNESNRRILCRVLEKLGYRVDTAEGGDDAIAMFDAGRYAAVLMDCAMPGKDGYETTAELRRREVAGSQRIPVIALTADITEGVRERCLRAGMDDYLAKPVHAERLDACLRRWISAPPAADGGTV